MRRIEALADVAQCAYSWSGKTFETADEVLAAVDKMRGSSGEFACRQVSPNLDATAFGRDAHPENPGDATYALLDDSHIRVCGNFRRSFDPDRATPYTFAYQPDASTAFSQARPAGVHCYEIELIEYPRDPATSPAEPS